MMNFTGGLLIIDKQAEGSMKNRRFFMAERWFISPLMQWDLNIKNRVFSTFR